DHRARTERSDQQSQCRTCTGADRLRAQFPSTSPCPLQRGWFSGERLGVGPGLGRGKVDAVDRACDGRAHVSRGGFGASHVGGASKAANALYKAGMATPRVAAARRTQGDTGELGLPDESLSE